ncbi:hypothetical protein N656DRAFT_772544 [Canariomyces notabilis]|uniref:Uncharacterized protein n=1 Tax=Canariomyces notabilis TaxID=2074819 RepID=A0AAN6QD81_9PEZI|nr:hypothetical protein N656DRAFT_772544 [Canariomyces arenarius]
MSSDSDATLEPESPSSTAAEHTPLEQTIDIDPDDDLLLWVGLDLGTPSNIRPSAMQVLPTIVHGDLGNVSQYVEIVQLYDIVMLVDKYGLHRALKPWVRP